MYGDGLFRPYHLYLTGDKVIPSSRVNGRRMTFEEVLNTLAEGVLLTLLNFFNNSMDELMLEKRWIRTIFRFPEKLLSAILVQTIKGISSCSYYTKPLHLDFRS